MDSFDVMAAEEIGYGDFVGGMYQIGNLYKFSGKILQFVTYDVGSSISCQGCVFYWRDENRIEACTYVKHRRLCPSDGVLVEVHDA